MEIIKKYISKEYVSYDSSRWTNIVLINLPDNIVSSLVDILTVKKIIIYLEKSSEKNTQVIINNLKRTGQTLIYPKENYHESLPLYIDNPKEDTCIIGKFSKDDIRFIEECLDEYLIDKYILILPSGYINLLKGLGKVDIMEYDKDNKIAVNP